MYATLAWASTKPPARCEHGRRSFTTYSSKGRLVPHSDTPPSFCMVHVTIHARAVSVIDVRCGLSARFERCGYAHPCRPSYVCAFSQGLRLMGARYPEPWNAWVPRVLDATAAGRAAHSRVRCTLMDKAQRNALSSRVLWTHIRASTAYLQMPLPANRAAHRHVCMRIVVARRVFLMGRVQHKRDSHMPKRYATLDSASISNVPPSILSLHGLTPLHRWKSGIYLCASQSDACPSVAVRREAADGRHDF